MIPVVFLPPFTLQVWRCETNTASSHLLGTWAPWIAGFFVSLSFYALLGIMDIVSRLLTVSGLVSLVSLWQDISGLFFYHWIPVIRVHIFSTVFPQTLHLETVCRILGGPAGLVLPHAGNDLYFMFHCSHPVWVNHFKVWLPLATRRWNHSVTVLWLLTLAFTGLWNKSVHKVI